MSFGSLGCGIYVMVSKPVSWSFFKRAVWKTDKSLPQSNEVFNPF
jgi:hypothetical protein